MYEYDLVTVVGRRRACMPTAIHFLPVPLFILLCAVVVRRTFFLEIVL
jgi:hypothetical protein